jgi:hypothetical protein
VGNFPCQILGASEIYTIRLIFDIGTEMDMAPTSTLMAYLKRVQEQHQTDTVPGWCMLDRILQWPKSQMQELIALDYRKPCARDFSHETPPDIIYSSLYPFAVDDGLGGLRIYNS